MELARQTQGLRTIDHAPLSKHGVLIEGQSGFGKSTLLVAALSEQGYRKIDARELLSE